MPYAKVPLTAAQKSFEAALGVVKASIYARTPPDTINLALGLLLVCHEEYIREDPPFYSYFDLTKRWGVSRKTVESWEIPEHKFGRTIRFKREDVLEWERERAQS